MSEKKVVDEIENGEITVGIELGSTRIKTVAIDSSYQTVASGYFEWENRLENGYWTYSLNDIWVGLQKSYTDMTEDMMERYGVPLRKISAMGVSAMMHGYLAFDDKDDLLLPFRTWRNNNTKEAAKELTDIFNVNIPERWSIAHFYQAVIDQEAHISKVKYVTTLAGYVHWYLTGKKVIGIGDASGMFPVDTSTRDYRYDLLEDMDGLLEKNGIKYRIKEILPSIKLAGETAGNLSEEGARLLDSTGALQAGAPLCPPEGDAGTGMVATNSVAKKTGNISAGTSAFMMVVLETPLKNIFREIDTVTTPDGNDVAMIHTNNCTSDINAWMGLFSEVLSTMGVEFSQEELYGQIFKSINTSDNDLGNLLSYGYVSGENITDVENGRPLFLRQPDSNLNLANFMKTHLYSAFSTMTIGLDLLKENENIEIASLVAHGGILKTKDVAQAVLAAATDSPVTVMDTANEGGAWGMAVLAKFLMNDTGMTLEDYLNDEVFGSVGSYTLEAEPEEVERYRKYIELYKQSLPIQRQAAQFC
ncbi:xylulokinase [Salinicoccus roseus]|uniref:xylulokinase n=1 Tax=Salinicoccus roseus TaxID=45670 RepID=UPI000F50DD1E|nr:FGGY-family carbohydrate kinase [Salinicoccus roseus]RPE54662.1 sugar (pentulose or hexulose) kinase [Salinicoccus roseus]GGA63740.1 ATPase [Salinicoccus roseus]